LVSDYLKSIAPENVKIISQGEIVAEKLKDYLNRHPEIEEKCNKNSSLHFLTTETTEIFEEKATLFFGHEVIADSIQLRK
jgi:glutamate racemase